LTGVRPMNLHHNRMHNMRRFGLCSLVFLLSMSARAIDLVSFQSIHDFKRSASDGEYLNEPVTEGSDGLLYGAAVNGGGPDDGGIVFRMEKSGANYQILHVFGPNVTTNGDSPWGGVIEGSDGRLYGATRQGGAELVGTIYSLAKDGSDFKMNFSFSTNGSAGRLPMNSVIQAKDGRLYGKTLSGGVGDGGTIFGVNTDGSGFQSLHSFEHNDIDHYIAYSGLIEGSDGMLYGTSNGEGPNRSGSVFRINKDGSGFETLYFFTGTGKGPDGRVPDAGVTEIGGILYGTTEGGGFDDYGVLYRIDRDGTGYRVLHEFTPQNSAGYLPTSPPIEGPDGALYGTTYFGGPEDTGSIYRINKDGSGLTFLYTFAGSNCPTYPYSALKILSDGAFYGTTFNGLGEIYGAVFRINPVSLTLTGTSIHVNGMFGQDYAIDGKDNVEGPWQEIARFTNLPGTDPLPVNQSKPHQFFRTRTIVP
jgi:uncharacterized repeat protein (TIGR03803 family)